MVCSRAIHRMFQDTIMHVAFGQVRRRIALLRTDHQFGCDKAVEKGVLYYPVAINGSKGEVTSPLRRPIFKKGCNDPGKLLLIRSATNVS